MGQQFSEAWLKQDAMVKRRVLRESRNNAPGGTNQPQQAYHEGYADGSIAAGTGAAPAEGYVLVWAEDSEGVWAQQKWPDGSNMRLAVISRWDTGISDNTYCHIRRVGRHMQIVAASCSAET